MKISRILSTATFFVALLIMSSGADAAPLPLGTRVHITGVDILADAVGMDSWSLYALATVADEFGNVVPGATVTGTWTACSRRGVPFSASGVTNASGVARIAGETIGCAKPCTTSFTVTSVTIAGMIYDPAANVSSSASQSISVCPSDYICTRKKGCQFFKAITKAEASASRVFSSSTAPNPFIEYTVVRFTLPAADRILVRIWSMNGEQVALLADADLAQGDHAFVWGGTDFSGSRVAPGSYIYSIESEGIAETGTIILTR